VKKFAFIALNYSNYWERLCDQNRSGKNNHSFVRRGTVGPKSAKILFFYVTNPKKDIRGFAYFVERKTGDAKYLWNSLGHESLLSNYDEYQKFLLGRKTATFVRFKNLKEFSIPISEKSWKKIIKKTRIPQGGMYINREMAKELLGLRNEKISQK
jgi:predicted transcriptional regulator